MRILVSGDRHWQSEELIRERLSEFTPGSATIIEGGAPGVDTLARNVALELGLDVETYWANWKWRGRAAGSVRNAKMLESGVDMVIVFHSDLDNSRGTANMIRQADRANITVEVIG